MWENLAALGFERESRAYRPHLTLARRARGVSAEIRAIKWQVRELSLLESVQTNGRVEYLPVQTWAFGG